MDCFLSTAFTVALRSGYLGGRPKIEFIKVTAYIGDFGNVVSSMNNNSKGSQQVRSNPEKISPMKRKYPNKMIGNLIAKTLLLAAFCVTASMGRSAIVTLTTSDLYQTTSFNAAGHWSDATAPSNVNDYIVDGGRTLRTPYTNNNYIFAGNSLTVTGGGILQLNPSSQGKNFTVNNLTLDGGRVYSSSTDANPGITNVLAGTLTLGSGGGIVASSKTGARLNVSAAITGAGALTITNAITSNVVSSVTISSTSNAYSGGTIIGSSAVNNAVIATVSSNLGTGDVTLLGYENTLFAASTLVLNNNATIADSANLTLGVGGTDWLLNLNFTGSETLLTLNVDGFYFDAGTYTAAELNAELQTISGYELLSDFTGTGTLTILSSVPEPSTTILLSMGVGGLLLVALKRKKALMA